MKPPILILPITRINCQTDLLIAKFKNHLLCDSAVVIAFQTPCHEFYTNLFILLVGHCQGPMV